MIPVTLLTDCCCLSAGVEVAEGIPAPFPLVAHNPAAHPPRAPPRAPRQASRNTATQAFTTCLLSDKPLSPPLASPLDPGAIRSPVVNSQHTAAAAAGASGPVHNQQDGKPDEGYEHVQGEHGHMHCNEQLDHGGHYENQVTQEQHQQQHQQYALGSASVEAEMVGAPAEHSARSYSPDERFTHPQAAAGHPAQSQVSDLPSQSCEDVQKQQALPACQQAEDPESMHHDAVPELLGAPAALPNHAGHNHVPQVASEQHQQPQQRQQCGSFTHTPHTGASAANLQSQQQQQMPVAQVQHDQVTERMHAPARSPSPSSHRSAPQQGGVPPNSDTPQAHTQAQTQAGVQAAGSTRSPTTAAAAVLAARSPQRLHPLPLLDPALLAQLSHHAHPQSPDAAAPTHHHSMNDMERSRPVTPTASAGAVVGQQPASAIDAAAQFTPRSDCPDKPQQPEAPPLSACSGPQRGEIRISPDAAPPASPGSTHKLDAPRPGSAQQLDEEQFEQDQLSQPSSSESDEDFQPSEYEQDELSQPSSSSDDEEEGDEDEDTFELDELSQPESSSDEQSPLRAESGCRVQSPSQAQPPRMVKSVCQDLPVSRDQSSRPLSAAATASGRSSAKLSRQGPLSADHKARLGFPKPAQATKAVPVQKSYLTGNSLPFNRQTLPIDQPRQGVKRPVQEVAAPQGGLKRRHTMKSVNDVHKVCAREARRLDEEYDLPAPAAQQVSHT